MAGVLHLTRALAQCSVHCGPAKCRASPSPSAAPLATWPRATPVEAAVRTSGANLQGARRKGEIRAAASTFQDDDYEETEEEIEAAYEALYGKPFGQGRGKQWDAVEDKDADGDEGGGRRRGSDRSGRRDDRGGGGRGAKSDLEERVVQIRRVTKVVKGGKQMSFRAVVVVGDKKGKVGVGVNKAKEVITAVQKASLNAKKNFITVPMTKYKTFPHRADGHFGAAHVMLRPASVGTGVIAGGAVRIMLEMAGVENALGKQIRSENPLNNARAVAQAISTMKTFKQVSIDRGIPMEELWK